MPEYLAPGVYVEEIPSGNKPIQGASTSTAGMVGMTARGPVATPTLVSSRGEYNRIFGGALNPLVFMGGRDALPYAAEGFFDNGGARLYVVRVVGDAAVQSQLQLHARDTSVNASPTLAAPVAEGDTTAILSAVGAVGDGDTLLISDGEASETVAVTADAFEDRVQIDGGLEFDHADDGTVTIQTLGAVAVALTEAAAAGDTTLTVDDSSQFTATETYLIQPAADMEGTPEFVEIASIDDATTVTLAEALTEDHAITDTFSDLTAGAATALDGAVTASPARVLLTVDDAAGIAAGTVLEIGGASPELVIVSDLAQVVTLSAAIEANHAANTALIPATHVMTVHARYPGVWGDDLRISVASSAIVSTQISTIAGDTAMTIEVDSAFGLFPGSVVVIDGRLTREVTAVDTNDGIVTLSAQNGETLMPEMTVVSQEFAITAERIENDRVAESETFDRLSLASEHPRYALTQVGSWDTGTQTPSPSGAATLIRLEDNADAATRILPMITGVLQRLDGGDDDVAGADEDSYIGQASDDPAMRSGIQALSNETGISICAVPGSVSVTVQNALIAHCDLERYRFAVLDTPIGANLQAARAHRQNFDTTRAAVYYPALEIADRFGAPGERRVIAPSGHVLGIFARTDINRGVHKAPANEVVNGILAFDNKLDKAAQDILNPINLNCFRDFRAENRGLRLYGARVASSDPEWRYVNVRRLLLFIEQSLDTGLQWAVFEPNAEPLWDTINQSVTGFLTTVWRSGALEGTRQEEAFFVNIGFNQTMTQDDIDNGRLILEIGVAPVKPAEFVIVRISQKTREATS